MQPLQHHPRPGGHAALLSGHRDLTGNLPALPAVYPDTLAPVVRVACDGERELTMMRWGFPPPPTRRVPVTNVRNVKSPYWRLWLKTEWRCLVPATSFCEWSDSRPKVTHWFALDESRPLFAFAGTWRLWTGERKRETDRRELFAFRTTEANEVVRPVHAKAMPVLLRRPEIGTIGLPGRLTKPWRCKGRCRMQSCASWLPAIRRTPQGRRNYFA